MSTATTSLKLLPSGLPDEATMHLVMGLREHIMIYYKGSCVQNLARNPDIVVTDLADYIEHNAFWRMRDWEMQQTNPKIVLLKGKPVFTLERKKLILYVDKKLDSIQREVEKFMAKYLSHIGIEHSTEVPEGHRRSGFISYEEYVTRLTNIQFDTGFYDLNRQSIELRPNSITEMPF